MLSAQSHAEGFSISPTGDYMAVDYHGEIVIVPTEQGVGEKTQVTNSPWRERAEEFSPDGRKIAYVSDEGGEQQVWLYDIASWHAEKADDCGGGQGQPHVGAELPEARVSDRTTRFSRSTSPAVRRASSRTIRRAASPSHSTRPTAIGSSTAAATTSRTPRCYLYDIKAKKEYNISQSPWNETNGQLTPDGKTLVFTSNRDGGANQLFAVSLARMTEDPNDPLVRERNRRAAGRRQSGQRGDGARRRAAMNAAPFTISVDLKGIDRRAVQLTRGTPASAPTSSRATDARSTYAVGGGFGGRGGGGGRGAATAATTRRTACTRSASTGAIDVASPPARSPACSRRPIAARSTSAARCARRPRMTPPQGRGGARGGRIPDRATRRSAARCASGWRSCGRKPVRAGSVGAGEQVNFAFNVRVDRRDEWKQILDESYRVMKYRYYDPQMHGKDWAAIYARVLAAAQVRRHERGRVRHRQRDDRRAELFAHRRERSLERHMSRAPTPRATSASRWSRRTASTV